MFGQHDLSFLDEDLKKLIIPLLDGRIVDNSKILTPSPCRMRRSHSQGWTKKWLMH